MRANKSHIYLFVYKDNDGYYTIVIALNIEHISVVANIVNGIERFLDVSQARPFCLTSSFVPIAESHICISMFGYKVPYHGK
jgi:hypothetical protein